MLSKIYSIARFTFLGNTRNKIFFVLLLFGAGLLASSLLFSLLGQEQEIRMLIDLGLSSIEFLALLMSVFLVSNIILEEIESKTIYLLLTRSVSKFEYLLGRYFGTLLSILSCMILMCLMHVLLLTFKGWNFNQDGSLYFISILMSFEKIILISALALLFAIFSSSNVLAILFTFFFWILGHFALELKFLSGEVKNVLTSTLFKGVYLLIPHFQYMNARDLWVVFNDSFIKMVLQGTFYAIVYSVFVLLLSLSIFKKKEF